jgi:hypothetical protein
MFFMGITMAYSLYRFASTHHQHSDLSWGGLPSILQTPSFVYPNLQQIKRRGMVPFIVLINGFFTLIMPFFRARARRKIHRHSEYWKRRGRRGSATSKPQKTLSPTSRITRNTASDLLDSYLSSTSIIHTGALRPPSTPSELPSELITQALQDLPHTEYLFSEALKSAENLDESDLGRWDVRPPFEPDQLTMDMAHEAKFTENLVKVMHGRRLRQQREKDQMRVTQSRGKSVEEIVEGLHEEIAESLREWHTVTTFLPTYVAGSRELRMADHYVVWQARKVVHLQGILDYIMPHHSVRL